MDKIILKNMAFYGYHGNLDSEKSQCQRFYVDVEIKTDLTKPGQTDSFLKVVWRTRFRAKAASTGKALKDSPRTLPWCGGWPKDSVFWISGKDSPWSPPPFRTSYGTRE